MFRKPISMNTENILHLTKLLKRLIEQLVFVCLLYNNSPWRKGKGGAKNGEKFRDLFIENGRMSMASLLKKKGYNTAKLGKWDLGITTLKR